MVDYCYMELIFHYLIALHCMNPSDIYGVNACLEVGEPERLLIVKLTEIIQVLNVDSCNFIKL